MAENDLPFAILQSEVIRGLVPASFRSPVFLLVLSMIHAASDLLWLGRNRLFILSVGSSLHIFESIANILGKPERLWVSSMDLRKEHIKNIGLITAKVPFGIFVGLLEIAYVTKPFIGKALVFIHRWIGADVMEGASTAITTH